MSAIIKARKAAGLVAAPWIMLGARALKSHLLYRAVLSADPWSLGAMPGAASPTPDTRMGVLALQLMTAARIAQKLHPDHIPELKRLIGISESQILQDVFCALALNSCKNGYFVEVGVGSGRNISNTFMLERHFGWSGILVEPNRSSHASIKAERSAILDDRAAASTTGQKLPFEEIVGAGEYSRVANTGGHTLKGAEVRRYEVDTIALNELLASHNAPTEIEYLSLDTEGSELDILRGLDLDKYSFKVMTIEHNHDQNVLRQLDDLFAPRGFKRVFEVASGFDAWYLHESVIAHSSFDLSDL